MKDDDFQRTMEAWAEHEIESAPEVHPTPEMYRMVRARGAEVPTYLRQPARAAPAVLYSVFPQKAKRTQRPLYSVVFRWSVAVVVAVASLVAVSYAILALLSWSSSFGLLAPGFPWLPVFLGSCGLLALVLEAVGLVLYRRGREPESREPQLVYCMQCGAASPPESRFCLNCGAPLK